MGAQGDLGSGIHGLGTGWVNFFAITDDDAITLVDCGFAGYHDHLVEFLTRQSLRVGDIKAVVLTHYHADHVGSAERIRRESGATVYAPEGDAGGVRGDDKIPLPGGIAKNLWRPKMIRYVAHATRSGGMKEAPVGEVTTYADGEVLDVAGGLRAIHMPGHTGGQCALLSESRGTLFAGDSLGTTNWINARRGPQLPSFNEDHEQARASLDRLDGVQADLLLCGHGDPFRGPLADAVEEARRP